MKKIISDTHTENPKNTPGINFFRNRINRVVISIVIMLLIGIFAYFNRVNTVDIFPNNAQFNYYCFTDDGNEGHSEILSQSVSDSIIEFSFHLKKGFLNPYVGLNISPKSKSLINLSTNNCIKIELSASGLDNMGLYVATKIKPTESNPELNELTFYYSLKLDKGRNTYEINTKELVVPDWALGFKDLNKKTKIKPNLQQVVFMNITSAYPAKAGDTGDIKIHSISFKRDNTLLIISLLVMFIVTISLLYIVRLAMARSVNKSEVITVAYKAVHANENKNELPDYLTFINNNFQNPELSLDMVSQQTTKGQRVIANDIQETFGCNFKTYVNQIRINESKRLLNETTFNIGEIAYKVGFNSQSHFNRVFKSIMNISPSAFRDSRLSE